MGFQNSVTQSLAGGAPDIQAQRGRPDGATMPESALPPAPAAAGAPTPTPAPANQPAPAQPEPQPPALIHPHHRSFFGAVASALVGGTLAATAKGAKALAGPQPAEYTADANGRIIRDPNQRPDTTSSRLQRLAEAAFPSEPLRFVRDNELVKQDLAAIANVPAARLSDYLHAKPISEDYADRIENAVANVIYVWRTFAPIKIALDDAAAFWKAVELADKTHAAQNAWDGYEAGHRMKQEFNGEAAAD